MSEDIETLDLRGLRCPLPALLARRHLAAAAPNRIVLVLTDDPMAPIDIPHMCRTDGFHVVALERNGAEARITLCSTEPAG